jgi:tetratricopeptide (TPR) repeat protein
VTCLGGRSLRTKLLRVAAVAGLGLVGSLGLSPASAAEPPSSSSISADHGSFAARDVNTGGGGISIGLTPEQVRDLALAISRQESSAWGRVEELSHKLDVTGDAVIEFFRILGRKEVPLEKLPETLAEIAARHRGMLDRLTALDPEDPAVRERVEEARAAIKVGDYDRADQLLSEAEAGDLAAVRMAEELVRQALEAADRRRLSAAATRAERGQLSLTRLDHLTAAEHFRVAAGLLPAAAADARGDYLDRYAGALQSYGEEKGDNTALLQAVGIYGKALLELPRECVPLQWAAIQNNLGNALRSLGEREGGTARLEQAVVAFRAALELFEAARASYYVAIVAGNLDGARTLLRERRGDPEQAGDPAGADGAAALRRPAGSAGSAGPPQRN